MNAATMTVTVRDLVQVWRRLRAAGWRYYRNGYTGRNDTLESVLRSRTWVAPDGRHLTLNVWQNPNAGFGSLWLTFGGDNCLSTTVSLTNRSITVEQVVELASCSALGVIGLDELGPDQDTDVDMNALLGTAMGGAS